MGVPLAMFKELPFTKAGRKRAMQILTLSRALG